MNSKVRKQLEQRKRRIAKRLDKTRQPDQCPVLSASNIGFEIGERTRAISAGGIGVIHAMVKQLGLDSAINRSAGIFKLYLPYSESDHVLNIAYNLLAGGTCLDHLELRRNDEAYLDALGAQRIPDPTTAGDFCRRFDYRGIERLQDAFNETRIMVWRQQGPEFFAQAIIDADGTMVETGGECKAGIDINHKKQWGYHPLLVSLANTQEPLYICNRRGNRPSHEEAAEYLDRAISLCRRAGFRQVLIRGDTDFTQTIHLDRWDDKGVRFIFGIDAMTNLYDIVETRENMEWRRLQRRNKRPMKTQPRSRPQNFKKQVVIERQFENIQLVDEYVAEFRYRPSKCRREYRVVVVWKDLEIHQGQRKLFDTEKCLFYITNDWDRSAEEIVFAANDRCDQENLIQQLKNGVHSLTAPLDDLVSNWAYMVIASLAWSLKAWAALLLPEHGPWKERHRNEKRRLLRMDFSTFLNCWIQIPAQIVRTSRRIVYRFLSWNSWQAALFRLIDSFRRPLRC